MGIGILSLDSANTTTTRGYNVGVHVIASYEFFS